LRDEAEAVFSEAPRINRSYWVISVKRLLHKKLGVLCLSIILIMYGAGILSPLVTPYDYTEQNLNEAKQGPSLGHPFGTDRLG